MLQSFFVSHQPALVRKVATLSSSALIFDLLKPELVEPIISSSSTSLSTAAVTSVTTFSDVVSLIDFSKYWFMFPTCVCVAICSISSGIGGAALFGPIFLIVFPVLGKEYCLQSPAEAVGIAILVETFGFSSGVIGYLRRGLIDSKTAFTFAAASMPAALVASKFLSLPELSLKSLYSLLMIGLSLYLLQQSTIVDSSEEETSVSASSTNIPIEALSFGEKDTKVTTSITDSTGRIYSYPSPKIDLTAGFLTAVGGVLCGLLGVGIGEVILPQLLRNKVPVPVAAATSTVVVALTCFACAEVQVSSIIEAGGLAAIPWSLVVYMIPGVVTGAQIAAALQGRFSKAQLERAIGSLFGVIGVAFSFLTLRQSGVI
mmetsp:Transcript_20167/g.19481  ORF Transcript_20167/g.19481 Transcript_20167/m.19481 type:complete len:373 (-) Transcript_20167:130-1248(-)